MYMRYLRASVWRRYLRQERQLVEDSVWERIQVVIVETQPPAHMNRTTVSACVSLDTNILVAALVQAHACLQVYVYLYAFSLP